MRRCSGGHSRAVWLGGSISVGIQRHHPGQHQLPGVVPCCCWWYAGGQGVVCMAVQR